MASSLTTRLGLALPIIQGPMTGSDTPALAAAVSAAGGLGMLGCGMRQVTSSESFDILLVIPSCWA